MSGRPIARVWRTVDFDYQLPSHLQSHAMPMARGTARLLVLHRQTGVIEHRHIHDIVQYLHGMDVWVNDSCLLPRWMHVTRLPGYRETVYLLRPKGNQIWEGFAIMPEGAEKSRFFTESGVAIQVERMERPNRWVFMFSQDPNIEQAGCYRLPTSMRLARSLSECPLAQAEYARVPGSFTAPTAGIHFTHDILRKLNVHVLTLHTSPTSFYDVHSEFPEEHQMDSEYYRIPEVPNRPVAAIGTTSAKALESWGLTGRSEGWSDLYIRPPFEWKVVDALLTNLHHPRETLLMLTCAFGGYEAVMKAHREAVREGYRFSYYGDLLLII